MNYNVDKHKSDELIEVVVLVRRVTKVVKGGSKMSFSVLVVLGDKNGRVGYGSANDKEVGNARLKAARLARKSMFYVPLKKGVTLHHDIMAKYCSGKVLLRSARSGTGIVAGGPMRSIFECLGVQDVVAKSLGSSHAYNVVHATVLALKSLSTPRAIADRRGIKVSSLVRN